MMVSHSSTCFQFVKRMNGNCLFKGRRQEAVVSCFQFVKRMNGNWLYSRIQSERSPSSCFQFAKRMNGNSRIISFGAAHAGNSPSRRLASNSWSVWMETSGPIAPQLSKQALLPIREAYEWKQHCQNFCLHGLNFLLPIREAYEWKLDFAVGLSSLLIVLKSCFQFVKRMNGNILKLIDWPPFWMLASNSWSVWMETPGHSVATAEAKFLLPIREAYEWKHDISHGPEEGGPLLASNSWSVWMETWIPQGDVLTASFNFFLLPIREAYEWKRRAIIHYNSFAFTCFQFVKRMNGNISIKPTRLAGRSSCFQFVKRMNGNHRLLVAVNCNIKLASNSWSVWMETYIIVSSLFFVRILLPIREAYEWKRYIQKIER